MLRIATVLACLLLMPPVIACSGSNGSAGTGGASSGGTNNAGSSAGGASAGGPAAGGMPNWEAWAACQVAEDCTVIPIQTCCGCVSTGVNTMYEEEGRASNAGFDGSKCPPVGCATQGCAPDAQAGCEMGRCVPMPGCSERNELTCEADEKCEKYQARLCTSPGEFAYFTCGKPKGACDDALTCFVSPAAQQVLFPDSCVPDGYTQACPSQCQ